MMGWIKSNAAALGLVLTMLGGIWAAAWSINSAIASNAVEIRKSEQRLTAKMGELQGEIAYIKGRLDRPSIARSLDPARTGPTSESK